MAKSKTGYLNETDRVIRKVEYLKWVANNLEFPALTDRRIYNFLKMLTKQPPAVLKRLKFVPSNRSAGIRFTIASDGLSTSSSCEIIDNRERENGRILRIEHDANQMLNFVRHATDDIYVEMLYPGQDTCEHLFSVIEYSPTVEEDIQIQFLFARDAEKIIEKVNDANQENILKARIDFAIDSKDKKLFTEATLALKKYQSRLLKKNP